MFRSASLSPEHSVAAKTGGCFPGEALATIEGGGTKHMRDLLPGDRVLASSTADGRLSLLYSPVVSFLDRQANATKTFYSIGTEAGVNITLTAAHLIFATDCDSGLNESDRGDTTQVTQLFGSIWPRSSRGGHLRTVFASEVHPGQCVFTSTGRGNSRLSMVTFVEEQKSTGLYAPLTQHGSIVVNGVLASCYAAVDSHHLSHWALAPLRLFYKLIGPLQAQNNGLHWYPWILQTLGKVLLDSEHFHPWGIEQ